MQNKNNRQMLHFGLHHMTKVWSLVIVNLQFDSFQQCSSVPNLPYCPARIAPDASNFEAFWNAKCGKSWNCVWTQPCFCRFHWQNCDALGLHEWQLWSIVGDLEVCASLVNWCRHASQIFITGYGKFWSESVSIKLHDSSLKECVCRKWHKMFLILFWNCVMNDSSCACSCQLDIGNEVQWIEVISSHAINSVAGKIWFCPAPAFLSSASKKNVSEAMQHTEVLFETSSMLWCTKNKMT